MSTQRILIVEDDVSVAEVLSYNLRKAGYDVILAADGRDGLQQAQVVTPHLIILDLMLPLIDGVEVCRRLRAEPSTRNTPVLMLTAKAEEVDQVVGFSVGADDYVTKPFSVKVLLERVKALLRRSRETESDDRDVVSSQGIVVDTRRHRATADDKPLNLTRAEFKLLETMLRQPGRVFTRSELISAALGDDALVLERTIDVHIRAVRQKLGEHADIIETARGVGYRLREPCGVAES
ncbi:MAG: response regulator [Pirellulales bacterium]|nr:response regulator [Pirellulales bacterium]